MKSYPERLGRTWNLSLCRGIINGHLWKLWTCNGWGKLGIWESWEININQTHPVLGNSQSMSWLLCKCSHQSSWKPYWRWGAGIFWESLVLQTYRSYPEMKKWRKHHHMNHRVLEWFGLETTIKVTWFQLPAMAGTFSKRPGCFKFCLTWPWTFPEMEHPGCSSWECKRVTAHNSGV